MKINLLKLKEKLKLKTKINTKIKQFLRKFYDEKIRSKKRINNTEYNYKAFLFFPLMYTPQVIYMAGEDEKEEKTENESLTLEMKDIVRGEYENKIRTFSSIEKRFLIFAKIKKFGDYRMTYFQYLDSLVPFQYIKTKSAEEITKTLLENKEFQNLMKKIDINGDGFINFEEYIILSVFMSISLKEYLKKYPQGKISREDLAEFLMNEISTIEALKITSKSMIDGRIVKTDYNTLYRFMVDFIAAAFKNSTVDINKDIQQFQYEVYLLMLYYEFYRMPMMAADKISIENFAKVLMSYVNIYKNKVVKRKIEDKLINLDGEVSIDEYVSFFWLLRQLQIQKMEVFKNGQLTFNDLRKLADDNIKNMPGNLKKKISDKQLQLLIDLFDENGIIIY